jgi:hypothetical protein
MTAKNAVTLLLKEVISIRFDQNVSQKQNCPSDDRRETEVKRSEK